LQDQSTEETDSSKRTSFHDAETPLCSTVDFSRCAVQQFFTMPKHRCAALIFHDAETPLCSTVDFSDAETPLRNTGDFLPDAETPLFSTFHFFPFQKKKKKKKKHSSPPFPHHSYSRNNSVQHLFRFSPFLGRNTISSNFSRC
jgi:hypothetical protein